MPSMPCVSRNLAFHELAMHASTGEAAGDTGPARHGLACGQTVQLGGPMIEIMRC